MHTLPGLADFGLSDGSQIPEASTVVFRGWQENPNSIFGDGGNVGDRKWMSGSVPLQEPSLRSGMCKAEAATASTGAPFKRQGESPSLLDRDLSWMSFGNLNDRFFLATLILKVFRQLLSQ